MNVKISTLDVSPVPAVVEASRRFKIANHLPTRDIWDYSRIVVTPDAVARVGKAYMDMPFMCADAPAAWRAMAEETARQFDFLTRSVASGGMGIVVSVESEDPYDTSAPGGTRKFFDDVENGRMRVLDAATTGGHFMFSDDVNNMFRAVHDVFGHAGTGRGVDRHGEEAAFRKHATMYSRLAQKALATETRGQNHAMIVNGGEFQEQKISILPTWAREFRTVAPTTVGAFRAAFKQAQQFHTVQGL
jgi:hypothetical protein